MPTSKWIVIINPLARGGLSSELWPAISNQLVKEDIDFDCAFTTHKYHAISLGMQYIAAGYRKFIVVGGDGTIHEVVNAIFYQTEVPSTDITLAVIPIGSGNDFIKVYDIPNDYQDAISIIADPRPILTDVGKVTFHELGVERARYIANVAGIGLDASVVKYYEHLCEKGHLRTGRLYMVCLIRTFLFYVNKMLSITVDGTQVFKGPLITGNVGIGRYIGGGMLALPLSVPDDGLFDLTLVPKVSKFKMARKIQSFTKGRGYVEKFAQHVRGKSVTITANNVRGGGGFLEIDGESMGTPPYTFTILPHSLKLLVGPKFQPHPSAPTIEDEPEF